MCFGGLDYDVRTDGGGGGVSFTKRPRTGTPKTDKPIPETLRICFLIQLHN